MKVVTETIEVKRWISDDGKKFNSYDECYAYEQHQKELKSGERKVCPRCHGEGRIDGHYEKYFDGGMYGDHQYHEEWTSKECPECGGKGYLKKETRWV